MKDPKIKNYKKQIKISIWIIVIWTILSCFGFPLWIPVVTINIILIFYHLVKLHQLEKSSSSKDL